ncbi:ion transporter [Microbulbifer sp. JMSA004]|uniref:ion transporter n=1 Tax=unclassified Microbulbifer TaxID=2619833 RepID=UPI0024AD7AC0|nr:ion transporter [Microbulbifer sp. VAAF005]WHI47489.1 ion transporter [Microbulbifer sp. VAAF005]
MLSARRLIDNYESKSGKYFSIFIQCLIVASLVSFSISTIPDLTQSQKGFLHAFEVFSVIVFTVEYLGRVYVAKNKLNFIFSFYGLIDLLAFLPFYIASGLDLRALRVVRLFQVFRVLKLLRYSKAVARFSRAFRMVKEELVLFGVTALILLYLAAVGIYYFENTAQPEQFKSIFHSLWWAVTTLTTVGYGDMYPVTLGGRVFTFFVLLIGLGVVAIPTGLVASALSKARLEEMDDN